MSTPTSRPNPRREAPRCPPRIRAVFDVDHVQEYGDRSAAAGGGDQFVTQGAPRIAIGDGG
jgi:hypothetical protein